MECSSGSGSVSLCGGGGVYLNEDALIFSFIFLGPVQQGPLTGSQSCVEGWGLFSLIGAPDPAVVADPRLHLLQRRPEPDLSVSLRRPCLSPGGTPSRQKGFRQKGYPQQNGHFEGGNRGKSRLRQHVSLTSAT